MAAKRLTKEDIRKTTGILNPVGHVVLAFKNDAITAEAAGALRDAGFTEQDILLYTADEATPNHNAVAAQNLIRLSLFTGDDQWRDKADRLIAAIAPTAVDNLYMHMALFNAIDLRLRAAEIVVTGEGARADELLAAARAIPPLDRIVLHARTAEALPPSHPARAQVQASSEPQAFVCIAETCSLPVTDPEGLTRALQASRQV